MLRVALLVVGLVVAIDGALWAGASKLNATLPMGVPLAGYNHGDRRVPHWPLPEPRKYTTFMMPSKGIIDTSWAKALVLSDGIQKVGFITLDGVGSDGTLNALSISKYQAMGGKMNLTDVIFSSSHSHSGPGAITPEKLWELAPATDLLVPYAQDLMATHMANVLMAAEQAMEPAVMDVASDYLVNVTVNRRAGYSPFVKRGTIDPHLGLIRVDTVQGAPIATLWNYAMHGTCFGPSNMMFSSDIMGRASEVIEQTVGGVALFVNADAGDVDPSPQSCFGHSNTNNLFSGGPIVAAAVAKGRAAMNPTADVVITHASQIVDFGPTNLNYTLARFNNCTSGGELDVCTICRVLKCDANLHLDNGWVEDKPHFNAFRFDLNGKKNLVVTIPGEALVELGWWIRNDTLDMGFDNTLLAGYSMDHMGYFATPNEYDIGGYESQLTLWGIQTASLVRAGCKAAASLIAP